jgi:hypothetical protein
MFSNINIYKKGELTTQQIVVLIVLIASFLVILFFVIRLNLGGESEKEICRNSVITRGSSVIPAESVPLKCSRTYVCLTGDRNCDLLLNPIIERVGSEEDVYDVLAEEMAECWWSFGEGKIDYVGEKIARNNYCSICSQLAFDSSLMDIKDNEGNFVFSEGTISKDKLYDYLSKKEYSDGITYSQYLFGTNNIGGLKQEILKNQDLQNEITTFGEIEIGKQYYVVMGIVSELSTWKLILVGAGVGVVAIPLVGWAGGAIIAAGGGVAGGTIGDDLSSLFKPEIAAIIVKGNGIDNSFMAPTIQEIDSDKFNALDCKNILTLN